MNRTASRILLSLAAASVALTPIAAQANTRAPQTAPVQGQTMSFAALLCTQQLGGCLLPLRQPAPPVVETPPPPVEAAPAAVAKKGGTSWGLILLGLGVLLGGALALGGGGSSTGPSNASNGAA
ncbi:MAG: hypothetical protein ABJ242_02290 [Marinomonas sp.]